MIDSDYPYIQKTTLDFFGQKLGALTFLPAKTYEQPHTFAIFTHGYTSHKGSLLTWASRLAEDGVSCIIFDLPGHYLGSFTEVESFDLFTKHAPSIFINAYEHLTNAHLEYFNQSEINKDKVKIILGGHSLGGLISLKALEQSFFNSFPNILGLAVGFGLPPEGSTHIFETDFYRATMKQRAQLVSPNLHPTKIFPWIKAEKETLNLKDKTIHFITGEDDLVVGSSGSEKIVEILKLSGANVTLSKPKSLPHHLPENAAGFIKRSLKKINYL